MESRFSRQMKKGVLEMLVLGLVCERPGHGYELIHRLAARSEGFLQTKEGTLYPILYRLEDDGLIVSSWQTGGAGRAAPKKIYTATQAGRSALLAMQAEWQALCHCVQTCTLFHKEDAADVPAQHFTKA